MDLKSTLNLPSADFTIPMKADLPQREPEIQARWRELGIYHAIRQVREGCPSFVLHDGPPYTNNPIHLGTALNKVLKDFVVKSQSMMGYRVHYVPGYDNHGLPIEQTVMKGFQERKESPSQEELRRACRAHAEQYVQIQSEQFQRLGVFGLWEKPYKTMAYEFEGHLVRVFSQLALRGYVYRGLRPTLWSPTAQTALADTEIIYKDKVSTSIYVRFALRDDPNQILQGYDKVFAIIWTTTPWTLPANLALAFHPELSYALVRVGGQHYLMVQDRVQALAETFGWSDFEVVDSWEGVNFSGMLFDHPFIDRESRGVVADYVTVEDGTGIVHTAPGHGRDDFYTGQRNDLPVLCPVNERGVMTEEAGPFAGMFYEKANPAILQTLQESGALMKAEEFTHSYPHAERDDQPVIFRATEQWFVNMDHEGLRESMLQEIDQVRWFPEHGQNRIRSMVGGRPDWCISRQRPWGVGIPVFYGAESKIPVLDPVAFESVEQVVRRHGSDAWFQLPPAEILPAGYKHPETGETEFVKETDVLDVWFDSGSSHQVVFRSGSPEWEGALPADLYLEGSDQHRGWFNSSLVISTALEGQAPYREVVTHGFVQDEQGRKMSKRLGNIIDPIAASDQYGADVLRLWVASVDYQNDVPCGDALLKKIGDDYRRIRNTLRFLLSNLEDFVPSEIPETLLPIDEWILEQTDLLVHDCAADFDRAEARDPEERSAYARYDFREVATSIHNFCVGPLSGFYLDVTKDRMYCDGKDWPSRKSAQAACYLVLLKLCKLVAPILVHTAEEVYQRIPLSHRLDSIHQETFEIPTADRLAQIEGSPLQVDFALLLEIRSELNAALEVWRAEHGVKDSQDVWVRLTGDETALSTLRRYQDELATFYKVSGIELHSGEPRFEFELSPYPKCDRSRIRRRDVAQVGERWLTARDRRALGITG